MKSLPSARKVTPSDTKPREAAIPDHGAVDAIPYDENLLDHARTQWQLGDWECLAKLDRNALQHHPERAKLALLAAAGNLQTNNTIAAKQLIRLAQDWGCSKKLIAQVIISGIYNSLGRAAVISQNEQNASKHFEEAIRLISPEKNPSLLGHARSVMEMTSLGLLPQASIKIDQLHRQIQPVGVSSRQFEAHVKTLDIEIDLLRNRIYSLQKQFDQSKAVSPVVGRFAGEKPGQNTSARLQDDGHARKYYGLNGLDKKLEAYLDYDGGYFVELGANDGVNQSNTYYFEKHRAWKGLLVEPIVHNFLKCKANRSSENTYACAACVSFSFNEPHVSLIYSNLMTTAIGLESDIPDPQDHADSGKVYLKDGEAPVEVLAPARTLTALLDEARAPNLMDLLSLDVEGAEIEVLKGIDHDRYRFNYLLVECRDEHLVDAYLAENGYTRVDKLSNHDYLFANTKCQSSLRSARHD